MTNVPMHRARARRAVALIEVLIATAVVAIILAFASLAATDARRCASLSGTFNNFKQYAWAGSTYAGDFDDRFCTFSWTRTEGANPPYPSDIDAAAAQATDIINRRSSFTVTTPASWVPHILYSHLVLADHLNSPLPLAWSVDPEDAKRLTWQHCTTEPDPLACFLALPSSERPTGEPSSTIGRWMVSSSYMVGPAFYSRDMAVGGQQTVQSALSNHYTYTVGSAPLGDRRMTQVAFPSRKVQLFDQYQRHFGDRQIYYAYEEARVPLLFADGSAMVRATGESNPGFYPNIPAQASPLRFNYAPRPWEPPTLSGAGVQLVTGHYQWTRGGLTGNDFSAPEVCTGQPGCTP